MTSLKGDPEVYPRVGKTDQAFRLSDGPAIQMSLNSLIAIASARASCISELIFRYSPRMAGAARTSLSLAIHSPSGRLGGALVVRQHGASNRVPQRLAGRTRQQRRADTPGAVRADGADRLILARKLVAERPQRNTRLGRDVLDGDVLQAPLHRQPQCGHWYC